DAGETVVDELTAMGREATFETADFASVDDVRELAAAVGEWADDLDILHNNAGGLFRAGRLTDLGVEYTFQVNHLAPYLLTAELLPTLADDARIVTTSSGAHRGVDIEFTKIRSVDSYSGFRAYQRSKLANVLFSSELARRLDRGGRSITANAFHPGAIPGSGFARFLPGPLPRLFAALGRLPMTTTVAEGAATAVYLAASPQVAGVSGQYFVDCEPETPSAAAREARAQRRLWEESARLLDIDEPLADDS
ncbi:MAG: SDR family NAD(P)-dependent oxidoreductase, partial [Halohasta sp.]